jgi:hypothetical protein
MKKVIAGLLLSMIGVAFSVPSMAASGDAAGQTKGQSGETGAAPKKGPSGETGTGKDSPKEKVMEDKPRTSEIDPPANVGSPKEVRKKSAEEYKAAMEKCDQMKGNEKEVCVAEARAARTKARAEADAASKNTSSARRKAQVDIAKAEYNVARAKCKAMEGDAQDKCVEAAKQERAKSTLETTTQEKASTAMEPKTNVKPNQERAGTRPETGSEKK